MKRRKATSETQLTDLRMCARGPVKKEVASPMCQLQLHKQLVTRVTEDSAGPAMLITILVIVSLASPTNSACHRLREDWLAGIAQRTQLRETWARLLGQVAVQYGSAGAECWD